ncbi:dihydrofolate reductase [Nisaea acidiphila]|uniref:Dihydrofolate reductase n=1 Tax=Nisaea acidiphila TaxID=1862145 RepID=A0A9J7ARH2_9PROT|nr:dihydrofolate reductase [Nisaea acidiphila]UUX49474.1 dihydrofolate reductase [Nisaea acidiphila]
MSDIVVKFPVPVIVVAVSDNGVIGDGEKMPWHLPGDLKRVKKITMGKPLVMGRKTFQSIGKPLPGRTNIVVTRDRGFKAEGIEVVHDIGEALDLARRVALRDGVDEIVVFGGAEIYRQAMDKVQRMHLTEIHLDVEGKTRFPDYDPAEWVETARTDISEEDDSPAHSFVTLERA